MAMESSCSPPETPTAETEWTLLPDLLLEIIPRSDARTLVRCAAACKLLRRDILAPPFIRRVTQQGGVVPPWILAYLNTHDDEAHTPPPLSLVHPTTPAAASFLDHHLSPYMSRFTDDLLAEHYPVTSRGGLVLLRRRHISHRLSNLCVHDPITGDRTFLPDPPGINPNDTGCFDRCVLLTSADGIGCSFLLFFPQLAKRSSKIEVHIVTSTSDTRAPAVVSHESSPVLLHGAAVVLHGGILHWLVRQRRHIVTYNVCTMEHGTINLPSLSSNFKGGLHLGSHDSQKLLRLLGDDGFSISVWNQLPSGDWPSQAMTFARKETLQSLDPNICIGRLMFAKFKCSGDGSSTVLLHMYRCGSVTRPRYLLTVLDLETKEMRAQEYSTCSSAFLEVDLPSRLRAMKIFS